MGNPRRAAERLGLRASQKLDGGGLCGPARDHLGDDDAFGELNNPTQCLNLVLTAGGPSRVIRELERRALAA